MNWFYVKTSFSILLLVICLLVLNYPDIHNNHIFPLGRLHKSIVSGDSFVEVREKFLDYYTRQRREDDNGNVQFMIGIRDEDFYGMPMNESQYIYLSDVSYFGDLQLGVIFDKEEKANQIYFTGD